MDIMINMAETNEFLIPIDYADEVVIDVVTPRAHSRRDCPNAPRKEMRCDFPYYDNDRDNQFEHEVDQIYRKAEVTNAIQVDDGYFPMGARCLAGRKMYKTYQDGNIIRMKSLLLLVKSHCGWLRTNVQLREEQDDDHEWDIEFIYE